MYNITAQGPLGTTIFNGDYDKTVNLENYFKDCANNNNIKIKYFQLDPDSDMFTLYIIIEVECLEIEDWNNCWDEWTNSPDITDIDEIDIKINKIENKNKNDMQMGGYKRKHFKSLDKKYFNFKTTRRPFSPSPKRKDFEKIALRKSDHHSICTYIHPDTKTQCKLHLGIYPRYCKFHTMLIENLYVGKSKIPNAGNGLYAGPMGFNKNDIIGEYSKDWMKVTEGQIDKRNGKDKYGEYKEPNKAYVYCLPKKRYQKESQTECFDALDLRSTIVRFANDSKYKNNAYFVESKDKNGKIHVYMVASKYISGLKEVYCDYGDSYFIKN